jgi:phosphate uptake regulator
MKRKVIKLATNTHVISLPANWCKSQQVSKGDELFCTPIHNKIVFSKKSPLQGGEVEINGDELGPMLKRTINEVYHSGADKVKVIAKNPETKTRLSKALDQLLGYHIIEQTNNTTLIEDLSKPDQEFNTIFRRFLLLIKTMIADGVAAMESGEDFSSVAERDNEVNKFAHLCIRSLSKNPDILPEQTPRMYTLIYQAEQLGDDFSNMIMSLDKKSAKNHLELFNALKDLYDKAHQFTFKKNMKNAREVANAYDKAKLTLKKSNKNAETSIVLTRANSFIKKAVSLQELFLHELKDTSND